MLSIKTKNKSPPTISVRVGHKIYVTNLGENPVDITEGTILCGFGLGKWKQGVEGDDGEASKAILFSLVNDESVVVHQGVGALAA